jgi:hypothetical protein
MHSNDPKVTLTLTAATVCECVPSVHKAISEMVGCDVNSFLDVPEKKVVGKREVSHPAEISTL